MSRPKTAGTGRGGYNSSGFRAWTEDEENRVKVAISEGKSIAEIMTKCNRTEKAIRMRLRMFADRDISNGASPDIVLSKYKISPEEFAEYNKEKKNSACKFPECGNQSSPKSTLGYCASHLNVERVGKKDIEFIMTALKQNEENSKLINTKLDRIEAMLKTITEKR